MLACTPLFIRLYPSSAHPSHPAENIESTQTSAYISDPVDVVGELLQVGKESTLGFNLSRPRTSTPQLSLSLLPPLCLAYFCSSGGLLLRLLPLIYQDKTGRRRGERGEKAAGNSFATDETFITTQFFNSKAGLLLTFSSINRPVLLLLLSGCWLLLTPHPQTGEKEGGGGLEPPPPTLLMILVRVNRVRGDEQALTTPTTLKFFFYAYMGGKRKISLNVGLLLRFLSLSTHTHPQAG